MTSIFQSQVLRPADEGLVIVPLLRSFLYEAEWPEDFVVPFAKGSSRRDPDGWFHPSEHPTWPERMLYYYLTQPDDLIPEPLDYMSTLSVTMGIAMHAFTEVCLKAMGLLMSEEEMVERGFTVNRGEPSVADPEVGSRGHPDGLLKVEVPGYLQFPFHLFEFKTATQQAGIWRVDDLDLEAFMAKYPSYYAQAQDYLRMTGLGLSVVLFLGLGYPWPMKEFHIPYNPQYANDTREKYRRVRMAVEAEVLPPPCCSPGSSESKRCPARAVCPIGSA